MKVISGLYKGRNLEGYNLDGTRPTMDRVKESLFAMIQDYIENSIVLDLFSGSGNLGIEALSKVLNLDYKKALLYFKENNIKFNIIFLDPPYKTDYIENSIKLIDEYNLLENNGIIVCESSSLDKIIYSNNYKEIKNKKYGDKYIVIISKI